MNILNIVGNDIELGNGIGRLIPEMIQMQNKYSEKNDSSLLLLKKQNIDFDFKYYFFDDVNLKPEFYQSFDLVIFHGVYFWDFLAIASLLKKNKIPYCIKPHSSLMRIAQKKSWLKKTIANFLFFDKFINYSNGIIYTNKDEEVNSKLYGVRKFIEANGIDFPYVDPVRDVNQYENKKRFIYLSRIDFNHKGIDVLLDALKILHARGFSDKYEFRFYGKGSLEDERRLEQSLKEIGSPSLRFYGPCYGEEKIAAFKESDVFVLTSRYEGFPMALLEAMHQRLPCLVTPGTNISEIVANFDVGWLVDFKAEKIADGFENIIKESHAQILKKGENARAYVLNKHDWKTLIGESEYTYQNIIQGGSS